MKYQVLINNHSIYSEDNPNPEGCELPALRYGKLADFRIPSYGPVKCVPVKGIFQRMDIKDNTLLIYCTPVLPPPVKEEEIIPTKTKSTKKANKVTKGKKGKKKK